MTTLSKIVTATVLSLLLVSCIDMNSITGVTGNGNVQIENRSSNESFNKISASQGLDVYLTQGNEESITVEADENLLDIIKTEITGDELRIYAKNNIGYAASKKITVTFKDIRSIESTSGSDIRSTNTIKVDNLELNTSSGSDMSLSVETNQLDCHSSSGSDLRLSGSTEKLFAKASSGSDIKAGDLISQSSQVKATSGSDITVNTSKELTASANSGGDVKYYGNPAIVNKNGGPSGSITKR
jgi:hypothetical protein